MGFVEAAQPAKKMSMLFKRKPRWSTLLNRYTHHISIDLFIKLLDAMAKVKSKEMVSSGDDSNSSSSSSRESSPEAAGAAQVISELKSSAALKGKGREVQ